MALSAKRFLGGGGLLCVAVAISSSVRDVAMSNLLAPMNLPGSSDWRPPPDWCTVRKLSGWRHTSVLKLQALLVILEHKLVAFFIDADWRFTADPLPALLGCPLDLIGTRDDHFVNLGLLVVRPTRAALGVARRAANRSFVAWDQALLNEELSAAHNMPCCVANSFFGAHFSRAAKTHGAKKRQGGTGCAKNVVSTNRKTSRDGALGPPSGRQGPAMWAGGWDAHRYNELMSVFHHRCPSCYNQCSRSQCHFSSRAPAPRTPWCTLLVAAHSPSATSGGGARAAPIAKPPLRGRLPESAAASPVKPSGSGPIRPATNIPEVQKNASAGIASTGTAAPALPHEFVVGGACTWQNGCCDRHPKACSAIERFGSRKVSGGGRMADGALAGMHKLRRSLGAEHSPGACASMGDGRPICYITEGGREVRSRSDDYGCRLPFNPPGVPDFLQLRERRPLAPSIRLPPRLRGSGLGAMAVSSRTPIYIRGRNSFYSSSKVVLGRTGTASGACEAAMPRRPLLIWRQSYPFNYMEFLRRILGEAKTLLRFANRPGHGGGAEATNGTGGVVYVPLEGNLSLPGYYEAVLGVPLGGHVVSRLSSAQRLGLFAGGAAPRGASLGFSSATLCCVRKPTKLNTSAAVALIQRIIQSHLGQPTPTRSAAVGSGTASDAAGGTPVVDVFFITRTPPTWAEAGTARRLTTLPGLLAGCRRSGRACETIDFGRQSFAEGLRKVRRARSLVGVHGAGLANAIFLPPRSVAVEILPRDFAKSAHSFGTAKFGFLPALGVRLARVIAKESDPRCPERARRVAERLRDCDVALEWAKVEEVLASESVSGAYD